MEIFTLVEYVDLNGKSPFAEWFNDLKDSLARAAVASRLQRLRLGNPGDVKPVGEGVHELRIFVGPGYRVYFGYQNETIVILLTGSDKKTQKKVISQALDYWRQHNANS